MEYKFPTLDKELENWYRKNNLLKTSHFIICGNTKDGNKNKILASKFGGRIPILKSSPKKECPKCIKCHEYLELLVQLYIPDLPTKDTFPKSLQKSLMVFLYCTECMENTEGYFVPIIYSKEEELKNLIYIENPKKTKKINEIFFTSFIKKELPPSEDDKRQKIPEGLNDEQRNKFYLKLEDFLFNFRDVKCFLGGNPQYDQGDSNPGDDYIFIINLADDKFFSMRWGDAGKAQIFMKEKTNKEFDFKLTWTCG